MHIQCTICSDLMNQAESLYVTKCGHIFHHRCLAQWIERSKSCPQCRNKVTEHCMFRLFPTVSDGSREDATTLQARLDSFALQLHTQQTQLKQLQDKLAAATADIANKEALLAAAESRLVAQECSAATLRQRLRYVRTRSNDADRLRDENQRLQKTLDMLQALQRVLSATAGEVEEMLANNTGVTTLATFAVALKRALCETESKKQEWRARQLATARALQELQDKHRQLETKLLDIAKEYVGLTQNKRKSSEEDTRAAKLPRAASPSSAPPRAAPPAPPLAAPPVPAPAPPLAASAAPPAPSTPSAEPPAPSTPSAAPPAPAPSTLRAAPPAPTTPSPAETSLNDAVISEDNVSFSSLVDRIVQSDSPYLSLRCSGLALCTLRRRAPPANLKPSELAVLGSSATSIFRQKAAAAPPPAPSGEAYDGLGGHSRASPPLPRPAPRPPARSAPRAARPRPRLRAPPPRGCRDIAAMFRAPAPGDAAP